MEYLPNTRHHTVGAARLPEPSPPPGRTSALGLQSELRTGVLAQGRKTVTLSAGGGLAAD